MTTDPLAQAAMVAYCGWDPTATVSDRQIVLDGDGSCLLQLPCMYVTAVSAVTVTDRYGTTTTPTIGAAGQVGWTEGGLLIWQGCGCWPNLPRSVAVTYSGGYASVPDDLTAALASLSGRTATLPAQATRMGTASVTFAAQLATGGLLQTEQWVFDRYRLPRVR